MDRLRRAMARAWWFAVAMGLLVVSLVSSAAATLPPEVYEQQRASAPVILEGVVQNDPGGRMLIRVQRVIRGPWRPGQVAAIRYPALVGPTPPPGSVMYYRPFAVGTRLRVFARPTPADLQIVDAGIDVLQAPPPRRGGCASCAVADRDEEPWLPWLTMLGLVAVWRRGRDYRLTALLLAGCGPSVAAPQPSVAPPPPPPPVVTETDGKAQITVLSRPDHPAVRPHGDAPAAPKTDAECQAAPACTTAGQCSALGRRCVAKTDADCLRVPVCAAGRCQRRGDRCEPTSCADGWACQATGACGDDGGRCVPKSAEGCRRSEACREQGRCQLNGDACLALSDEDCTASRACTEGGRCHADNGACVAMTLADCRAAPGCRGAACRLRNGHCISECGTSTLCRSSGLCSTDGDRCVATRESDCVASESCHTHGRCSVGLRGTCVAADDVDCRRSQVCREEGRCSHDRGRCVPGSPAECRQALVACKVQGRCRYRSRRCVE